MNCRGVTHTATGPTHETHWARWYSSSEPAVEALMFEEASVPSAEVDSEIVPFLALFGSGLEGLGGIAFGFGPLWPDMLPAICATNPGGTPKAADFGACKEGVEESIASAVLSELWDLFLF